RPSAAARPAPHRAHGPRRQHPDHCGGSPVSVAVEIAVQDLAGLEVDATACDDRDQMCTDLDCGVVTAPPVLAELSTDRAAALVAAAEAKPHFDVHVLIRSRAGEDDFLGRPAEFTVTADEIELMAQQAEEAVSAGAAGVVIGALTESGQLDVPALETL